MRRFLNFLYDGAAMLAALCMVALLIAVLLSIVSRQMNFLISGIDAYAGYLMAGAGFLAMAHTLKRGEHIRVTLIINALKGRSQKSLEIFALTVGTLLALLFAYYSVRLAWQSHEFNDISTSNDATALWIPQLSMAVGAIVMAIACADELILEILGRRIVPTSGEALRNE
ncbi:hypothetical protein SDC9_105018 [bioreactor metagenome]|uniref:Tripartite ATP-independent periplasmic transporters DctQ component domain-containing protein n=1 Tax=bioreactor metagenome TaxID=1076179 RepID=A0A645AZH2_9ZZZZ